MRSHRIEEEDGSMPSELDQTVAKFKDLFSQLRAPSVALSQAGIQAAMDAKPVPDDAIDHLATHISANSLLTKEQALPIAKAAITAHPNSIPAASQAAADSLSSSLSSLTGSATLNLSNPIPLPAWYRVAAGVISAVFAVLVIVYIAICHSNGTAEYVALGVLGGLGWLGMIVLVMGYQNVSIQGSSGSPAAGKT